MNVTTDKKILDEAINSGCKTVAELALYLKTCLQQNNVPIKN